MRRALFLLLLTAFSFFPLPARDRDSLKVREGERFRWPQLAVPAVLMTAGAVGVGNPWIVREINAPVRDWGRGFDQGWNFDVEDGLQYVSNAVFLLAPGGRRDHGFGERTLILAISWLSLGIMVNTIKYTVRDMRPDLSARNSFPSGHTATAFMGAELVRKEFGPWWGTGAYILAAGTGFLRIVHDRHWFNDVLGGAAVGILCANIGYWLLPYERRLFPCIPASLTVVPRIGNGLDAQEYGFALSWVF